VWAQDHMLVHSFGADAHAPLRANTYFGAPSFFARWIAQAVSAKTFVVVSFGAAALLNDVSANRGIGVVTRAGRALDISKLCFLTEA
jgi:hypothetical protein